MKKVFLWLTIASLCIALVGCASRKIASEDDPSVGAFAPQSGEEEVPTPPQKNESEEQTPTVPVAVTPAKNANAPSDGGVEGVSQEAQEAFLRELSQLPHYDATRANRYLAYYGSKKWSNEQIIRIVNTNNDLSVFTDAVPTDTSRDILMLANKYNDLGSYAPNDLVAMGNYATWGELRAEAREAFVQMIDAAAADGYTIIGVSPYRSFERQERIYNNYVSANGQAKADTFSARPGFSEHQTGLAMDVAGRSGDLTTFGGTAESEWMLAHAHEFGFILRYGDGMDYITGYMYEPWHFRYVGKKVAAFIKSNDLTFEEYYYYYVVGNETTAE